MIHALIDGDWVLYAAGFAGQKPKLVCPRLWGVQEFNNITAIRKQTAIELERDMVATDLVYTRYQLDPLDHFFHSAKNMMRSQCDKIAEKFGESVTAHVYIDGDGNFRSKICSIKPYKGHRSVHAKPLKYNDIRQYMLDNWNAQVVHDQETDDAIAIAQTSIAMEGGKSIIVSVDKDFLQVPGWHMNPNKGFKKVDRAQARKRLYIQCLTGDTVDNIGGCFKIGPDRAKRLLAGVTGELTMWRIVVEAYENSGDHYNGLSGAAAALENMRLVFLRRTADQMWMPPEDV